MNVFVLSTGRCGSTTFARACQHIENFSAAHESRIVGHLHDRLQYPENHIESDNRLSWLLGRLDQRYGDDAFYVHLKRDRDAVANSYARRYAYDFGIIKAYKEEIICDVDEKYPPLELCKHYYHTVNRNIELFLADKSHQMEFRLEFAKQDFRRFWVQIDAVGELEAALSEWDHKHNASNIEEAPQAEREARAREKRRRHPPLPIRIVKKVTRIASGFPQFVRDA